MLFLLTAAQASVGCHVKGWIQTLERKLEIAAESAHPDFRCFFSAEPINGAPQANIIPESILQNCIKVSNEPPSGEDAVFSCIRRDRINLGAHCTILWCAGLLHLPFTALSN